MPWAEHGIHEDEVTIAEMLKEQGYATGIFGKWHLGHHKKFLPLQHGFDEYLGIPYSNDMWPVDFDGTAVTDSSLRPWKARYPPLPLVEGNEKIRELTTLEDQGILTTLYTEKAVDFIQRHKDAPFFLYVPHSMPHVPLGVSDKFKGKSRQGMYGDVMMEIDWSVGQILNALEENGLEDNTLVIFTTDNGPWLNFGNHAGSTGGLREGKGTSFEGGQRVPCIMRWPGMIPEGKVCNRMAATLDILPTLADITGARLPEHKIDGVSILELLRGNENANPRDHLYYYYHRNSLEAVGKDHWKLVFPHPSRSYEGVLPGNDGWPGDYNEIVTEYALYDLRRDPGEEYDVQELYPEVVAELEQIASRAREDLGDDLKEIEGTNVRQHGTLDE
jgi:arylsulfatase